MISDTELRLAAWRSGSTQAERLAAAALRLSGYEAIDPQHPLGGPDGGRDIICIKGGLTWVGAVYFPVAPVRFAAIKKKFLHDLQGVTAGRGMAFVTNQTLSVMQRKTLSELGQAQSVEVDIFHLERLVTLLDAAPAYGVRLQFLNIAMSPEDQLAWFADSGNQLSDALGVNTRELMGLKAMVQRLGQGQAEVTRTLSLMADAKLPTPDLLSTSVFVRHDAGEPVTRALDTPMILLFHRLICFDLPERGVGALRTSRAWLSNPSGARPAHIEPPPPAEIPDLLEEVCASWRSRFPGITRASPADRRLAVAKFHARFLSVHPFFDGNGRVARAILMQQCLDLFGRADMSLMERGADYYAALTSADRGDPSPLADLLEPVTQS